MEIYIMCVYVYVCRIREVTGFDDTVAGNFIFWFLQAVTLPLHGRRVWYMTARWTELS